MSLAEKYTEPMREASSATASESSLIFCSKLESRSWSTGSSAFPHVCNCVQLIVPECLGFCHVGCPLPPQVTKELNLLKTEIAQAVPEQMLCVLIQ